MFLINSEFHFPPNEHVLLFHLPFLPFSNHSLHVSKSFLNSFVEDLTLLQLLPLPLPRDLTDDWEHIGERILTWRVTPLLNAVLLSLKYVCVYNYFSLNGGLCKDNKTQNNPALSASSSSVVCDLTFLPHFPENVPSTFQQGFDIQFPILKWDNHFQMMEISSTGRIKTNALKSLLNETVCFTPNSHGSEIKDLADH